MSDKSPTTLPVAEIKARLAEVHDELARAWGVDVEGGLDEFIERLTAQDRPGRARGARLTRELARTAATA